MVESFELVTAQNYCLFAKKNRQRPTIYFFLLVKYKIRVKLSLVRSELKLSLVSYIASWNELSGIGCICDPGFDGEFCEITTTIAPPTTFSQSNTDDYDYDYSTTDIATTDEVTQDTIDDTTEDTTENSIDDYTEENDAENDVGDEQGECENPNPEVITIGNGTILQAYCDEGSLNGTR